ncbi:hypothetical protein GOBAR_DD19808 [Gossypium barbadense]|nr:hypothetical protein GOBAR_DD19808 [Gossypium barbadense]
MKGWWNHEPSYMGLPEELEDFRLLLDQHFEAEVRDAGQEGVLDSVRDGGNAQIRLGVAIVWVEAMNSAATVRHEGVAQGGHVEEERKRLGREAQGAHLGLGS